MEYRMALISLDNDYNSHFLRNFSVEINGLLVKGKVKFRTRRESFYKNGGYGAYQFLFEDKSIVKHPDYKNLRRKLLIFLVDNNPAMSLISVR